MLIRSQISWEIDILCDLLRFYTYLQIFTRIFRLHLYVSFYLYFYLWPRWNVVERKSNGGLATSHRPCVRLLGNSMRTARGWALVFHFAGTQRWQWKRFHELEGILMDVSKLHVLLKGLGHKTGLPKQLHLSHVITIGPHCKVLRQLVMFVEKLLICDLYKPHFLPQWASFRCDWVYSLKQFVIWYIKILSWGLKGGFGLSSLQLPFKDCESLLRLCQYWYFLGTWWRWMSLCNFFFGDFSTTLGPRVHREEMGNVYGASAGVACAIRTWDYGEDALPKDLSLVLEMIGAGSCDFFSPWFVAQWAVLLSMIDALGTY